MTNAKKHFGKAITPPLIKLSSLILNYGWIGCLWIVLLPVGLLGQNANQGFLDVLIVIKEPTCPGEADGIIKVNASGGDGQYTYKWGSGSESPTQTGLSSGLYSITVTDGAGSIASKYVPLNDPIALTIPSVQLQNPYEADNPELPWSGKPEGGMSPYTTINGAVLVIGDATIDQKDYELIIEPDKEVYTIEEGKSGITRAKVMALAKKRQVRQIPFIKVKDHNGCEVIRYLSPNRLSDVPKPIEVVVEPVESEAPIYPQLEGVELVYKEGIPKKLGGRSIKTGRRVIVDEDYIEIAVWDS
ncbi:MAG: SprB repeat-containing protein, partial [Chitinophagales bacterium]